ncbi:MAG: DUF2213 domain-containing protein [Microcoleaceae cyanobacterium]
MLYFEGRYFSKKMAIRWDSTSPARIEKTSDGRLVCQGLFCRSGVLIYKQPDGSEIRELRRPESNSNPSTLGSFRFLPATIEHPPGGILDTSCYKQYAIGTTGEQIEFDPDSGGIQGTISLYDADAIRLAESREKSQLSAGYTCDLIEIPGIWNNQPFDREQINVIANHIALTSNGRGGQEVSLRLDSIGYAFENKEESQRSEEMVKVKIDSCEYDEVPAAVGVAISQKLQELDILSSRFDTLNTEYQKLADQLNEYAEESSRLIIKLDSYQSIVSSADALLNGFGYVRTDKDLYVKSKSLTKKKKAKFEDVEDEEDEEDEDEDIEADEEMGDEEMEDDEEDEDIEDDDEPTSKKKKTSKQDSLETRLAIWNRTDSIIPNYSKEYFDPTLSSDEICRDVVARVRPDLQHSIGRASDTYVRGVFDSLALTAQSQPDYSSRLDSAIKEANGASDWGGITQKDKKKMDNCKTPLTMSKRSSN